MKHLHIRWLGGKSESIYEMDVAEAFTIDNMPLMIWVDRLSEITVEAGTVLASKGGDVRVQDLSAVPQTNDEQG
jgi:hypothetical protein